MSFVDQVISAVQGSDQLSADTRGLVVGFLQQNEPLLERLGQEATQGFVDALNLGGAEQAFETLVEKLAEPDLLALLKQIGPQLDAAIDWRAAATAQWRTFAASVGSAALGVLTQAVLAAV